MRESKIVSYYCFIFVITSFLNTNCAGSKSLNSSNATPNLDPIDTTSSLSTLPRSQSISKPEKNNQRILVSENNNDLENAKNILKNTVQEKNELRITVEDGASKIPGYLKDLSSNGVEVSSVSASKPTLDDVFLEVTGYRLEGSEDITKDEEKGVR